MGKPIKSGRLGSMAIPLPRDLLTGRWVTSYSGWMRFDPPPVRKENESEKDFADRLARLQPQFGGYRWIPPRTELVSGGWPWSIATVVVRDARYEQREGYFAYAALSCFKFYGDGRLAGITDVNRGGHFVQDTMDTMLVRNTLLPESSYTINSNSGFDIYEGTIKTFHENTGNIIVENNYSWMMRNANELDWVLLSGSYRPLVAHGTLIRVLHPPLPFAEVPSNSGGLPIG
jgi:hypothetical protein